jgi:hypothetical protein
MNTAIYLKEIERELDKADSGLGPAAISCDNGNEPFGFLKGREYLDQLSDYCRHFSIRTVL